MLQEIRAAADALVLGLGRYGAEAATALHELWGDPQQLVLVTTGLVLGSLLVAALLALRYLARNLGRHRHVGRRLAGCNGADHLLGLLFETMEWRRRSSRASLYLESGKGEGLRLRATRVFLPELAGPDPATELADDGQWSHPSVVERAGSWTRLALRLGDAAGNPAVVQLEFPEGRAPRWLRRHGRRLHDLISPIVAQLQAQDAVAGLAAARDRADLVSASSRLLITASLDPLRLGPLLLDLLIRSLGDTAGCVFIADNWAERPRILAVRGLSDSICADIAAAVLAGIGRSSQTPVLLELKDLPGPLCSPLLAVRCRTIMAVRLPLEPPRRGYIVVCRQGERLAAHHARIAQLNAERLALSLRNADFHRMVFNDYKATLAALVNTHEADPGASAGHARRVATLSADLGRRLGMPEDEVEAVRLAGDLHDVGMVGLPPDLLNRVGRLPPVEYDLVKQHPEVGAVLTAPIEKPACIAPWILHHHERFDGHGYPAGLAGGEIPLAARIIGLAEVFDAMVTSRQYREAMSFDAAMQRLRSLAGAQLDPHLVDVFTADMTVERWAAVCAESLRKVGADEPAAAKSGIG